MKLPFPHSLLFVLPAAAILTLPGEAAAQSLGETRLGFRANVPALMHPTNLISLQASEGRPRWVKWGLVGAVAGALAFALLGQTAQDPNPVVQDAAFGALAGFAILGGSIAIYDSVCKPESASERAGLC